MGRGKASRSVGANAARLRQCGNTAKFAPDKAGLRDAVLEVKKDNPDFGVKRIWKVLHGEKGWEVSQQRVHSCLRAAGLVCKPPSGPPPQIPGPAAVALFMGTHNRLGEQSMIRHLESALLEQIMDIYNEVYAEYLMQSQPSSLPGADIECLEEGEISSWRSAFEPHQHEVHGTDRFQQSETQGSETAQLPARRRRGNVLQRVQHLRAAPSNANGSWRSTHPGS